MNEKTQPWKHIFYHNLTNVFLFLLLRNRGLAEDKRPWQRKTVCWFMTMRVRALLLAQWDAAASWSVTMTCSSWMTLGQSLRPWLKFVVERRFKLRFNLLLLVSPSTPTAPYPLQWAVHSSHLQSCHSQEYRLWSQKHQRPVRLERTAELHWRWPELTVVQ